MAITAAFCNSYKQELLQGVHEAADTYMIALYGTTSSNLSKSTTAYTTDGETSGTGYTAGGAALVGYSANLFGDVAVVDFTTDPTWPTSTITASGALIYNASQSNKACVVLSFGSDIVSTAGTFTVTFPAMGSTTGLIRIA